MPLSHRIKSALSNGLQLHGAKFPFVVLHRATVYSWRRLTGPGTFQSGGRILPYYLHPYILSTERAVELPVAWDYVRDCRGDVLEVGNVLSTYYPVTHDVVDKYERAPGVLNEDIVTYAPGKKYDLIVTISTLEHVGWDETPREQGKIERAIAHLKTLLKPGGRLVVTLPIGYNPWVDEMIDRERSGLSGFRFLKRISANNRWQEAAWSEVRGTKFGSPYPCANAIAIGYFPEAAK